MKIGSAVRRNIARNLWIGREAGALSRERIAAALGWPVEVVIGIEKGDHLPSAAELQMLCRWYGIAIRNVYRHPNVWRRLH